MGETTNYTVDIAAPLSQVLSDGTNTYFYGMGRIAQESTTDISYFLPDALSSVRQLADSSGGIPFAQSFDPFGNLLVQTGTTSTFYGFVGEWTDQTELQHLRARYYAPSQGRFLTKDPFPGLLGVPATQHPYMYALTNPVLYSDPTGEFVLGTLLAFTIAGGVLGGLSYYAIQTYLDPWRVAFTNGMVDWEASTRADFVSYTNVLSLVDSVFRSDVNNPGWTDVFSSNGETLWVETYGNRYWDYYHGYTTNQRRGVAAHEVGHMLSIGHIPRDYSQPTLMPHIIYAYEFPDYHSTIYSPQPADIILVNSIYP